jgi:hypothetical protein
MSKIRGVAFGPAIIGSCDLKSGNYHVNKFVNHLMIHQLTTSIIKYNSKTVNNYRHQRYSNWTTSNVANYGVTKNDNGTYVRYTGLGISNLKVCLVG